MFYYPIFLSVGIGRMLNTEILGWMVVISLIISYGAVIIHEQNTPNTEENEKQQNILLYISDYATVFLLASIGIIIYRQFKPKTKIDVLVTAAISFSGVYVIGYLNKYFDIGSVIGKTIKKMN